MHRLLSKLVLAGTILLTSQLRAQTASSSRFYDGIQFVVAVKENQFVVVTADGVYFSSGTEARNWRCVCAFEKTTFPHYAGGGQDRIFWIEADSADAAHRLMYFDGNRVIFVRTVPSYAGAFITNEKGCIGNKGNLIITVNGGKTWSSENPIFEGDEVVEAVFWLSPTEIVVKGSSKHLAYCEVNEKGEVSLRWQKLSAEVYKDVFPFGTHSLIALRDGNVYSIDKGGKDPVDLKLQIDRKAFDGMKLDSGYIFAWRDKNPFAKDPGELIRVPVVDGKLAEASRISFDKHIQSIQISAQIGTLLFTLDGQLFELDFSSSSVKDVPLNIDQKIMNIGLDQRRNKSDGINPNENERTALIAAANKAGITAEREIMAKAELLKVRSTMTPRQYTLWLTAEFTARIPRTAETK